MREQDLYKDTNYRMHHDAEFRAVVDQLANIARVHGFTPGELKQIAFAAALKVETSAFSHLPSRYDANKHRCPGCEGGDASEPKCNSCDPSSAKGVEG